MEASHVRLRPQFNQIGRADQSFACTYGRLLQMESLPIKLHYPRSAQFRWLVSQLRSSVALQFALYLLSRSLPRHLLLDISLLDSSLSGFRKPRPSL